MELDTSPLETGHFKVVPIPERLLASLAEKLRKITFDEQRVIETVPVSLKLSSYGEAGKTSSTNQSSHSVKKKHAIPNKDRKIDDELRRKLAAKLGRDTPVIQEHTVKGLVLTHNERKKIIAAVSLAEGSFVSANKDSEFQMQDERAMQIPVTYNRVVHVGLSWGLIQFTQDSGNLGELLKYMREKRGGKFDAIFGDNAEELVKTLLAFGVPEEKASGLAKWHSLTSIEKSNYRSSRREIRGARVQPIAVSIGGEKRDIWEEPWLSRFRQASLDDELQEAQLEYAVMGFFNTERIKRNVYTFCMGVQLQTALGLALVVDRAVQRGPASAGPIISALAKAAGIALPFTGPAQEKKLADYIVQHGTKDHARRVKLLLADPYRLLTVPLYDWDTYDPSYDK